MLASNQYGQTASTVRQRTLHSIMQDNEKAAYELNDLLSGILNALHGPLPEKEPSLVAGDAGGLVGIQERLGERLRVMLNKAQSIAAEIRSAN